MPFGLEQYALIADTMRSIAGKAILSVNDRPEMRQAFKGLRFRCLQATVAVNNKPTKGAVSKRAELLIQSW